MAKQAAYRADGAGAPAPTVTRKLLDDVCAIAVEAGRATLPVYHSDFDIQTKDDDSPLTQADLRAHRIIRAGLAKRSPDCPQLSEEGAAIDPDERLAWRQHWLIDPLDGTREFVNKNDQFTINIALIKDHMPMLGVVYAPVLDTVWFGAADLGAWRRVGDAAPAAIRVSRADPSKPRVLVSRSHRSGDIEALLARMPDYAPVSMGSSLKFCVIAEGGADFYPRLGPTSEWDTAAGHAVLLAAGGQVTNSHRRALAYNKSASLLNEAFIAYGDRGHDWHAYLANEHNAGNRALD